MRIVGAAVIALAATLVLAATGRPATDYRDGDFFQFYAGAHAIIEHRSPYDTEWWVAFHQREGSRAIYAPPQPPSGPPAWTTPYPLWTFLVALPVVWLPLSIGAPAWLITQLVVAGVAFAAVLRRLVRDRGDRFVLWGLAISFHPLWVLPFNGNISGFLFAAFAGATAAATGGRPFLAGALAALLITKPQSYVLAVPALLLVIPHGQRRRAVLGALVVALPLVVLTFILQPDWVEGWLRSVGALQTSTFSNATIWTLHRVLGMPDPVSAVFACALVGAFALWWWRWRPEALAILAVAIPLSIALAVHGWTYEQLPLLISAALLLRGVSGTERIVRLLALAVVLVVLPWTLAVVARSRGGEEMSVLVPLAVAALAAQSGMRMSRRTGSSSRAEASSSVANRRS